MNMNEQAEFASKVRRVLDHGLDTLPNGVTHRLYEARQEALKQRHVPVMKLGIAGNVDHTVNERIIGFVRTLLSILALSVGVMTCYYWNSFEKAAENEEIDSALLADELPPSAYLDHGFHRWIEHNDLPVSSSE